MAIDGKVFGRHIRIGQKVACEFYFLCLLKIKQNGATDIGLKSSTFGFY